MIGIRGAAARLTILACAAIALVPATASAQVVELAPIDEGFDCRASSVRVANGTAPDSTRFEPFVANRDVFPCIDADSGAPGITQVPGAAAPEDPRAVVGAAFARTRDGEAEPPGETPPPEEELGVVRSEAGAANVFLTNGEAVIHAVLVRAEASVSCENGQPVFQSSSAIVGLAAGDPAAPTPIIPPEDDPTTPEDESHIDIPDEEGPIHIGHSTTVTDPATGITTHTRRALWLENGNDGDEGEIVVGEASVSVRGNPCTGRITIVKNTIPDDGQDFRFTGAGAGFPAAHQEFFLDDDEAANPPTADPGALPRVRDIDFHTGATITETKHPNFRSDATCVNERGEVVGTITDTPAAGEDPGTVAASVDPGARGHVTCTFVNVNRTVVCPDPARQQLNDQGQCVAVVIVCPDGTEVPAGTTCAVQCPTGSTQDPTTNTCIVDQTFCPGGSTDQSGQCVRNETICPPGSTFNASGQCVVTQTQCPPGSVRNAIGECVSTQVVSEDVPRGGVVVPISQVPGASASPCSRPGFGTLVGIVGTNGPDRITGTNRSDRIFAFGGRDRVSGGRGNDCVEGGSGNDNLDGSNGNDFLLGGTGRDILNGGTGRDQFEGGSGSDKLTGGSGSDRANGGAGRDKISGGPGNDRLDGGAGGDFIEAGQGGDRVNGGSGNDAINVAEAGPRGDVVNCGSGRDTVRIDSVDRVRNCERVLVLRSPRR